MAPYPILPRLPIDQTADHKLWSVDFSQFDRSRVTSSIRTQRHPKLQEEERERKDNYVPEVSALDVGETGLEVDPDTKVR